MAKKKMYTFVQDFVNGEPPSWKRADQRAERRADRKARMINAVTETSRTNRAFANATRKAKKRMATNSSLATMTKQRTRDMYKNALRKLGR